MSFDHPASVALVEDDADFRQALVERLTLEGCDVRAFSAAEPALKVLDADFPGVVVTDLRMPGLDGRQLLSRLQALDPTLPVILITGHGDIADAVAAMHDGAYDFVAKPFPFERLQDSLKRALEKRGLVLENRRLAAIAAEGGQELPLAGSSRAVTALRATIAQIADARMDVLIEGETGTGKEAVARALHNGGRRRLAPFVAVNCGALPDGLIESELFGHELGAFAGALRRRVGHVERAHNGSLFLDEVESMPLGVQVKMLRVLEEREVHPIGANEPRALDLRVLASSKVDLGEAAKAGTFREDLYYRLNVVRLRVPPLRERREDIPLLFAHFLRRAADRHGVEPPAVDDAIRRRLLEADWPGNIRELAHYAERVALSLEETARPADEGLSLPERLNRFEADLLRAALEAHRGDIAAVLAEMRVPRKTLYDKLQRHGLKPAAFRSGS
ncbi:MAG: Fis family transcriptional regulator [Brevundimonas sp.]|uniref:Sigma-54 dependent transcriptional regulator n=1 Tax=Brevundimonas albigilva TaxID=1312364 RepID=A0ABY4SPV8_9CAUL|nr:MULTISPECIES: sigma-54 dependent transcriptional regulator [Brevundimonas]PZU57457.1 MAG: Fis family transcriptional regulator [Brevundimonas sp.]UQV19331.1 sigma-54 dependent transcriptional regulator [Brevundimonas albigilva]URI15751.1 sigma-54 dependent transcriptional regulator [Brevundimonas albigilva]